jgi:hypothetical protein
MRGWTLIVGLLMAILLGGGLGMALGAGVGLPPLGAGLGLAVLSGTLACFIAFRRSSTRRLAAGAAAAGGSGADATWLTLPSDSPPESNCGDSGADGGSCDGGGGD